MSSETDHALTELGHATQAYQAVVADYDREVARLLGVNETDLRCLELLLGGDELTPGDLATALGLTTGSITAMLDRLEKLGLLTRDRHPSDRRRSLVHITEDAARWCFELISPHVEGGRAAVAARFDLPQLRLIADFLHTATVTQAHYLEQLRGIPTQRATRRRVRTEVDPPR